MAARQPRHSRAIAADLTVTHTAQNAGVFGPGELVSAKTGSTDDEWGSDTSYRVARYSYFNSGQVSGVCFDDDATVESGCDDGTSIRVGYEYDAAGRRIGMSDPRGDTAYVYGDGVNLTLRVNPDETETAWTWNQNSQVDTLVFPDGAAAAFTYRANGAIHEVDYAADGDLGDTVTIVEYGYTPDGLVATEDLHGSTWIRAWEYDHGTHLPSNYHQEVDGTETDTDLEWDPTGRLASATDTYTSHSVAYSYDIAGQLLAAIGSDSGASDDWTYQYYPGGLRYSESHAGATNWWYYNEANQLTSSTWVFWTTDYQWDGAGRLRATDRPNSDNDTTTSYDERGKVSAVDNTATGEWDHQRVYNGDGQLAEATIDNGTIEAEYGNMGWDLDPVPQQIDGEITVSYLGTPVASDTSRVLQGNLRLAGDSDTGGMTWFAYDHQGNTIDSDTYNTADAYTPYGHPTGGTSGPIHFGYRGEMHLGNELHLRNRNYETAHGIFNTPDPLDGIDGTPTVANPYHYADNDPQNRADPLGLTPEDPLQCPPGSTLSRTSEWIGFFGIEADSTYCEGSEPNLSRSPVLCKKTDSSSLPSEVVAQASNGLTGVAEGADIITRPDQLASLRAVGNRTYLTVSIPGFSSTPAAGELDKLIEQLARDPAAASRISRLSNGLTVVLAARSILHAYECDGLSAAITVAGEEAFKVSAAIAGGTAAASACKELGAWVAFACGAGGAMLGGKFGQDFVDGINARGDTLPFCRSGSPEQQTDGYLLYLRVCVPIPETA